MQNQLIRKIAWLSHPGIKSQLEDEFQDRSMFSFKFCFPTDTMWWVKEVEMAKSVDDLQRSQSIGGHRFPNFEVLDAKITFALKKIISNPNFMKKVVGGARRIETEPNRFLRRSRLLI